MKMKKYIWFLIPLLILISLSLFSLIADLMRTPSDITVTIGVILICVSLFGYSKLFNYIIKQFKQK